VAWGLGALWEENFSNEFSSKKCRFLCIFLVKNYAFGQKPGQGGLIDPLGVEDVKCTG